MKLLNKTESYLRHIARTVDALSCMVCCPELSGNVEKQRKIIINMIELEQATADFVDEIGLMNTAMQTVAISKYRFTKANERVIEHLESLQSQDCHFEELITTLKLENTTLKIEAERF